MTTEPAPDHAPTLRIRDGCFTVPYAHLLRPLSDAEFLALRAAVQAHGIRSSVIIDLNFQVLDGHYRLLAAGQLDIPAENIPFLFVEELASLSSEHEAAAPGADPALFLMGIPTPPVPEEIRRAVVLEANPLRRLAAPDAPSARAAASILRMARVARVAASGSVGISLRTIVAREGVSLGQIQRDVALARARHFLPPAEEIQGRDGRTYKRTRVERRPGTGEPAEATPGPSSQTQTDRPVDHDDAGVRQRDQLLAACAALEAVRSALAEAAQGAGDGGLADRDWIGQQHQALLSILAALDGLAGAHDGGRTPQEADAAWAEALHTQGQRLRDLGRALAQLSKKPKLRRDAGHVQALLESLIQAEIELRRHLPPGFRAA